MKRKRVQLSLGAGGLALLIAVGAGLTVSEQSAVAQSAPAYVVDPWFPRPFSEDYWVLGAVTGITVDHMNRLWVVHRGNASLEGNERGMYPNPGQAPSSSVCCLAAPYVLEYDTNGNLVSGWGGPSSTFKWPEVPGGIAVDTSGNVWITAAGQDTPPPAAGRGGAPPAAAPAGGRGGAPAPEPPPADAHVLKFSRDGRHLLTIGTPGKMDGPASQTTLNRPSAVAVDSAANEVFVADLGNRRIVVFDATSGAYKRHWFAYGERAAGADPGPYSASGAAAKSFRDVTCIELARDGMVYVCDKSSNRIQVFDRSGKFIREGFVARETTGPGVLAGSFGVINAAGAVWDVAISPDQQQLFVADGVNKKIRILNRADLTEVGSFGQGGRYPGTFLVVNAVATDSGGNVYTGETHHGKRIQKFVRQ
jgi:DNA-binding beta-propeller fold protein YncE